MTEATTTGALADQLEAHLAAIRKEGRAALVTYGVAGYPDLPTSLEAFRAMSEAGADVLEIGPPFSDPLIDGPVIQRAVSHALEQATRFDQVLEMCGELTASISTPVVLLVYYNLLAHRGHQVAARDLAKAGVCGVVVPDLPPEEGGGSGWRRPKRLGSRRSFSPRRPRRMRGWPLSAGIRAGSFTRRRRWV